MALYGNGQLPVPPGYNGGSPMPPGYWQNNPYAGGATHPVNGFAWDSQPGFAADGPVNRPQAQPQLQTPPPPLTLAPQPPMTFNYSSAITAGPVWDQAKTNAGASAIQNGGMPPLALPGMPASASQMAGLQSQGNSALASANNSAALDFSLNASQANAQQQLASETARAQSGVKLANLGAQLERMGMSQSEVRMRLLAMLAGQEIQ